MSYRIMIKYFGKRVTNELTIRVKSKLERCLYGKDEIANSTNAFRTNRASLQSFGHDFYTRMWKEGGDEREATMQN